MYAGCESDCSKEPPPLLWMVLCEVVNSASDKLDKTFRDMAFAKQILEEYSQNPDADENSNLKKLLRSCWRLGSFEKIRCLGEHSSTT